MKPWWRKLILRVDSADPSPRTLSKTNSLSCQDLRLLTFNLLPESCTSSLVTAVWSFALLSVFLSAHTWKYISHLHIFLGFRDLTFWFPFCLPFCIYLKYTSQLYICSLDSAMIFFLLSCLSSSLHILRTINITSTYIKLHTYNKTVSYYFTLFYV